MKREEAIKILQPIGEQYCEIANITLAPRMDEIAEAIDMAIDALKAQLSQEGATSDLISRQAALDIFDDYNIAVENGELEAYSRDRKRLCELQSVQPERKKGKWIYNSPVTMKCDQCGLVIKDWDWHRFKFCPNCDCDMRGEQE